MNTTLAKELKKSSKVFSEEEIRLVSPLRIPKHIAIMMDGNRRWALQKGLPPMAGHMQGVEALVQTVRAAADLGVEVVTVYAFSTENWNRSPDEVRSLMHLFKESLLKQKKMMIEEGVRLGAIGDVSKLPFEVRSMLEEVIDDTKKGSSIDLVIALNYGGRDELRRAIRSMVKDCMMGNLNIENIDERKISSYLDTAKWKDPELLIRTSGESRISNFLLWQISYTEIVMIKKLWPDFSKIDLLKAIIEYQKRDLRIGR